MSDYNLTLEERAVFERLVRDNANACIDLMKARENVTTQEGRVSATQHAINDYVNQRTKRIVFVVQGAPKVPTGTQGESPIDEKRLALGVHHARAVAPVHECCCSTCCEVRTLASIGHPAEGLPFAATGSFPDPGSG